MKAIIYHELKNILFSPKFSATFVITSFLLLMSVYIGINQYNNSVKQYDTVAKLTNQEMREQRDWMGLSNKAQRQPEPMQIFVSGVGNDIGRYSLVNSFNNIKLLHSVYSDDPVYAIFRFIDFTFIVMIVFSLLAIMFTYNAINGEAESGTLQLVFSNPVPRAKYILAKFFGIWMGLVVPVLIPILLSILIVLLFNIPFSGKDWIKLANLILLSILYFTFFITLGIFISTLTKRSSVSFLILLMAWIVFVFVIPRAGIITAGQIITVPTSAEIQGQQDSYQKDRWEKLMDESSKRWRERNRGLEELTAVEREAYRESKEWEWMEEEDKYRKEVEIDIDKNYKKLMESIRNKKLLQEKLAFSISRISPVSSFQLAAMNIAGTGLDVKENYEDAMNRYRADFNSYKERKQKESGDVGGIRVTIDTERGFKLETSREKGTMDISQIPKFVAPEHTLSSVASVLAVDYGIIAFFSIAAFAGAFIFFLRYDVR